VKPKQPDGQPMTLVNMRELGVQRLIASCLSDAAASVASAAMCGRTGKSSHRAHAA
jgi:hypothetical protein